MLTRYRAHGVMPMGATAGELWSSWSFDYWAGSGGGSGGSHRHLDESRLGECEIDFVGYHLTLPPETVVHSGHGPDTQLGGELASNPFLGELRT